MALITRSSVLAVVVESTEGTPVLPTSASEYLALQDDFTMSPELEQLDNAELKSSIGKSKSFLGLENPTASFSHYLRHSGTQGTAPNYKQLLKAAFGAEDDAGVEHDTVASSTTTVVKVDTGEGATYIKGQALLIKDPVNGYSIRPVHSISSNDLTLGFRLTTAPGTSVNLGEAITYYPANSGHQTLSLWHYIANGGAVQMMAGSRVVECSITWEAGQLINTSFSLEGISFYFDPINITATDTKLDFSIDSTTYAATVTAKVYKNPHELASALQTAMLAAAPTETTTFTYSNTTGKFTFTATTATTFSLLWNTGTNAANTIGDKIGFSTAADDTGALTYTSDNAQSWSSPQTPSYDSADPLVAKNNEFFIGDATDNVCFCASSVTFTISTPKTNIDCVCAESGRQGSLINERTGTLTVQGYLDQHDAEKFKRYLTNQETRAMYNFGSKSGGNWEQGKSGCLYLPHTTITSHNIEDADGLVALSIELQSFVPSDSTGEMFLSFV